MSDKLEVPFEREERYIVIKRKHLDEITECAIRTGLNGYRVNTVECVVVESDWPEYETVWRMIEDRVTGRDGGHRAAMVRAFEASGWSSLLAEKQADIALSVLRTPTPEQAGEVERMREAIEMALKCTPANSNFYDCGDPFEILREAYEASTPPTQPTADVVERAMEAMRPLVNDTMAEPMLTDWLRDLATAAHPTMAGDCVMVPREPSEAMIKAGKPWAGVSAGSAAKTYRAMLSAAHVDPSHSRLKGLLAASPTGGE